MVVRENPSRGTEAVAVLNRADLAAIGERDRGGAVPRLHQGRVILVECVALGGHGGIALPRLGDEHHHRVRERPSGMNEQLHDVVE